MITALRCGIPDRVPVMEYIFSPKLQQNLLGYTTPLYYPSSQLELGYKLGLDGMWISINGFCGKALTLFALLRRSDHGIDQSVYRHTKKTCLPTHEKGDAI
jgi:hypothetical protein